jgi:hypothetical protein
MFVEQWIADNGLDKYFLQIKLSPYEKMTRLIVKAQECMFII